jgi:hypothetical protein
MKFLLCAVQRKALIQYDFPLLFNNGGGKWMISSYGGGLEYLHRNSESRIRRRNGNPVPGGITGPPCQ